MAYPEPMALIVMKESLSLTHAISILSTCRFNCHVASSAHEALSWDGLDSCEVILLDRDATGESLDEVLGQIASRARRSLLAVACRADDTNDINSVLRTNFAEYILKPIRDEELVARIARLRQRQSRNDELSDSLKFINRVVDSAPVYIYLFDAQSEQTIYINRQAIQAVGCSPKGIQPKGFMFFHSVAHSTDIEGVLASLRTRFENASDDDIIRYESRILNAQGKWRWLRCRESIFAREKNGRPSQISGIAIDVTDRKQLDDMHALLAAIVESSDDAIIGKTLEGKILSWNTAAEKIYGYSAMEAIGENISFLIPAGESNEVPRLLDAIRAGGRLDHYPTARQRKDGVVFPVEITISPILSSTGAVTGASTTARPITCKIGDERR